MLQVLKLIFCLLVSAGCLVATSPQLGAEDDRATPEQRPAKAAASGPKTKSTSTEIAPAQQPIQPDDPALQEILQIRKLHGSVLKGSLLEKMATEGADAASSADPFIETLRRLANENPPPPATVTLPAPVSPPTLPSELPTNSSPNLTVSDQHFILSLRSASRALEAKANEHEDAGSYEAADRLRALADQLRREARAKHLVLPKASSP